MQPAPFNLENVALLGTSSYNLFSLSKLLNSGWKMQGDATKVVMLKRSMILTFDLVTKTMKGALFCAQFKRKEVAIAGANAELTKSMSINKTHRLLSDADKKSNTRDGISLGIAYLHWQNEAMRTLCHRQGKTEERK